MHIIAAKAVAFKEALAPEFRTYQAQILKNAQALAAGLQEGGARLVSGGTDNHLMMVDVTPFDLSGKKAQLLLDDANITVNKNAIPFDTKSPLVTSGIRLGTPALTTRGMTESEMTTIASLILEVLRSNGREEVIESVAKSVAELCGKFPLAPSFS